MDVGGGFGDQDYRFRGIGKGERGVQDSVRIVNIRVRVVHLESHLISSSLEKGRRVPELCNRPPDKLACFSRVSRMFLAFCSRFARVLLACSCLL